MNIFAAIDHLVSNTLFVVITTISSAIPIHQQAANQQIPQNQVNPISITPTSTPIKENSKVNNHQITKTPTQQPTPIGGGTITATSVINANGKTIHLDMNYPANGGEITGNTSGDCNGNINGIYDGPNMGTISGDAKASCPFGLIAVPVTITYTGQLSQNATQARINYTVSAIGTNQQGTTILIFSK